MSAVRRLAVVIGGGVALLLLSPLSATPAQAHGAPSKPPSRAWACGPEGGEAARSPACRAAIGASGPQAYEQWDEVRVPGVNGRDRAVIPDGRLCSGGLDQFRGLDLARSDWPVTPLTAGAALTFGYESTIPHTGTFRMYLTRTGYNLARPLRWADLDPKPFLTVTNPDLRNTTYLIPGRLPAGRTGRQLIYTIWQNSDTPDTYYSCTDVFLGGSRPNRGSGPGTGAGSGTATPTATPTPTAPATPTATTPAAATGRPAPTTVRTSAAAGSVGPTGARSGTRNTVPFALAGAAVVLAAALAGTLVLLRRRTSRALSAAHPRYHGRHRG